MPSLVRELKLKIMIQAAKGYSISYKRPKNSPKIPLILAETKVAVTPLEDILRFGGTLELTGMDLSINQRRVKAILKAADDYLVDMCPDDLELVEIWRGLRPCTPDGLPLLGRSEQFHNLIVAAGHAMQGLSLGPISGKLAAQLALNEKPCLDINPLRIERFS